MAKFVRRARFLESKEPEELADCKVGHSLIEARGLSTHLLNNSDSKRRNNVGASRKVSFSNTSISRRVETDQSASNLSHGPRALGVFTLLGLALDGEELSMEFLKIRQCSMESINEMVSNDGKYRFWRCGKVDFAPVARVANNSTFEDSAIRPAEAINVLYGCSESALCENFACHSV